MQVILSSFSINVEKKKNYTIVFHDSKCFSWSIFLIKDIIISIIILLAFIAGWFFYKRRKKSLAVAGIPINSTKESVPTVSAPPVSTESNSIVSETAKPIVVKKIVDEYKSSVFLFGDMQVFDK